MHCSANSSWLKVGPVLEMNQSLQCWSQKKNLKSRNHRFHWSIRWVWAHIAPLPFSTPLSMCNPIVHIRYVTQNKLHNFNFVYIFKNAWMFCYVLELKWSIESKLFRLSTSFVLKVLIHQPININQSQHQPLYLKY